MIKHGDVRQATPVRLHSKLKKIKKCGMHQDWNLTFFRDLR